MPRRNSEELHKAWIAWGNKVYDEGREEEPLLKEAYFLLEDYAYMIQLLYSVCVCSFCGEEYWCRDVGEICPNCGANVSQADMLNWSIFSANRSNEWAKAINKRYEERGDWPLKPKGSPEELLLKEIRSFRKSLYQRTTQDHENYDHILRYSLIKIKWLKNKLGMLRGKPDKLINEEVYECKCGWSGPLGEAYQNISGIDAMWMCPKCIKRVIAHKGYGDEVRTVLGVCE